MEKGEEPVVSEQQGQRENPVDMAAKRWLDGFLKSQPAESDYNLRLTAQVVYWTKWFQDAGYDRFVANRASLGFLCRALSENLKSVDQTTEFGKHWIHVVKVCVPLLEQLEKLHDEFDPGDVKLEFGKHADIDLYLEVFVEPKEAPRTKHGRSDHGSEALVKAHVPTLVKELLQRLRHFSQSIPRRRRQSEVTYRFTTEIQKLTGSRDYAGWLPDPVQVTFKHKDDTDGYRYEEPFFYICLEYVRAAQAASRYNRHKNGVDSTVSVQGKTKRVTRSSDKSSDKSLEKKSTSSDTTTKNSSKKGGYTEVTKQRKGKVGKHAGNPDRDRSKYDKNKERNEQRKLEKAEASKPLSKNQWDERRIETLKKQMVEAQQELEKLEKKNSSTEETKETLDEFVKEVAEASN